jgi:hypothetical protein
MLALLEFIICEQRSHSPGMRASHSPGMRASRSLTQTANSNARNASKKTANHPTMMQRQKLVTIEN